MEFCAMWDDGPSLAQVLRACGSFQPSWLWPRWASRATCIRIPTYFTLFYPQKREKKGNQVSNTLFLVRVYLTVSNTGPAKSNFCLVPPFHSVKLITNEMAHTIYKQPTIMPVELYLLINPNPPAAQSLPLTRALQQSCISFTIVLMTSTVKYK